MAKYLKGAIPWNKGLKGLHLSPSSEFKPGHTFSARMPIGSTVIRERKDRSDRRVYIKTAHPNTWKPRAVAVWEAVYGPVPPGCIVHHMDRDKMNDSIDNLELTTRKDHLNEHRSEYRRPVLPRGSSHHNSSLNEEKVADIKRALATGESIRSQARKYGVAQATIQAIHKGRTWVHVTC